MNQEENEKLRKYFQTFSPDQLQAQLREAKLYKQGNEEMSESARLGLLPYGAQPEDYEHEAEEAAVQIRIIEEVLKEKTK